MKKKAKKRRPKKQIRASFGDYLCVSACGKEVVNRVLRSIALIVFLYGAWLHSWLILLLSLIPFLVGTYYEYKINNTK